MTTTPDQPDGIEDDSHDLPTLERAAQRVAEFLEEWGDGRVEIDDVTAPLYARDLEALRKAPAEAAKLTRMLDAKIGQVDRHVAELDRLRAELKRAWIFPTEWHDGIRIIVSYLSTGTTTLGEIVRMLHARYPDEPDRSSVDTPRPGGADRSECELCGNDTFLPSRNTPRPDTVDTPRAASDRYRLAWLSARDRARGHWEAAQWIRDEHNQLAAVLAEVHAQLDRLDESGEDFDTDTIRATLIANGFDRAGLLRTSAEQDEADR